MCDSLKPLAELMTVLTDPKFLIVQVSTVCAKTLCVPPKL